MRFSIVLALCVAFSSPVRAETVADAQARVNAASQRFGAGDYEGALTELRVAEAIAAKVDRQALPGIRFNIARCLEELGRTEAAIEAYEAYNALPDASHRKRRAFQALERLRKQVYGTLTVVCDPQGSVIEIKGVTEGRPSCPWTNEAVQPGSYALTVNHPGYLESVRLVSVQAGRAETVQVALERDPDALQLLGSAPPPRRVRPLPWVLVGVGTALTGAGVAFQFSAGSSRDEAEDTDPGSEDQLDAISAFERDRALALTSYGLAAGTLVAGIILFIVDGGKKDGRAQRTRITPGGLAVNF